MGIDITAGYWNHYDASDPRTKDLPLINSPMLLIVLIVSYLYFVLKYGPEYMKRRKPYDLTTYVKYYNVFQILINGYIVQQFYSATTIREMTICDASKSYDDETVLPFTMWLVTLVKVVDLSETVVYVLRKKTRQISTLHLYHHVSTLVIVWFTTKFFPVPGTSFSLCLNCWVHVIMYTYYLLSSFGEGVQRIINPFKSIITTIQMVQFIMIIFQNFGLWLFACPISMLLVSLSMVNITINFILFYDFYQTNYVKSSKNKS